MARVLVRGSRRGSSRRRHPSARASGDARGERRRPRGGQLRRGDVPWHRSEGPRGTPRTPAPARWRARTQSSRWRRVIAVPVALADASAAHNAPQGSRPESAPRKNGAEGQTKRSLHCAGDHAERALLLTQGRELRGPTQERDAAQKQGEPEGDGHHHLESPGEPIRSHASDHEMGEEARRPSDDRAEDSVRDGTAPEPEEGAPACGLALATPAAGEERDRPAHRRAVGDREGPRPAADEEGSKDRESGGDGGSRQHGLARTSKVGAAPSSAGTDG
jgi:hypothetical protein